MMGSIIDQLGKQELEESELHVWWAKRGMLLRTRLFLPFHGKWKMSGIVEPLVPC